MTAPVNPPPAPSLSAAIARDRLGWDEVTACLVRSAGRLHAPDAEDAAHEAVARFLAGCPVRSPCGVTREQFRTLHRLLRNRVTTLARRHRRRGVERHRHELTARAVSRAELSPLEVLIRGEEGIALGRGLMKLSDEEFVLFRLCFVDGLALGAIAQSLHVSPSTACVRRQRLIERLRSLAAAG